MEKAELLAQADDLLGVMASREPGAVAGLAHYLSGLAQQENLTEIADAADDLEHAAIRPGPKSLTKSLSRLSEAVVHAQDRLKT